MTPQIVRSVVRRHLKSTHHFVLAESSAQCPVNVNLNRSESIVGWYSNPPGEQQALLVFTTESIHVIRGDDMYRLNVKELESCTQPDSKESPKGIMVVALGKECFLPMAGSHGNDGQFKDAYNLFSMVRGLLPAKQT